MYKKSLWRIKFFFLLFFCGLYYLGFEKFLDKSKPPFHYWASLSQKKASFVVLLLLDSPLRLLGA